MTETRQVSFTQMKDGSTDDYRLLQSYKPDGPDEIVDKALDLLKTMRGPLLGYKIDRYQHALQTATRAMRDGAEEEMVVAALLHDVGDVIAPDNHSQVAAAILRPYVSERTYWIVLHHGIFQGYYFWHHVGRDRDARERFRGHPYFQACADFCELWDQASFDPDYDTLPLEAFSPMVHHVFSRRNAYFG